MKKGWGAWGHCVPKNETMTIYQLTKKKKTISPSNHGGDIFTPEVAD